MVGGKPGAKPGTPSPNKKFWVIQVKGGLARIEWPGHLQPPGLPTYFEDEQGAANAAHLVSGGMEAVPTICSVTRKWLESLRRGEKPGVKVITLPTRIPIVNIWG